MKLRLLVLPECNRRCVGCCNKGFDLNSLPQVEAFKGFEKIILTGGEPLLKPGLLINTINRIRSETKAPIYVQTAYREDPVLLAGILNQVDGITLTLHSPKDVEPFKQLDLLVRQHELYKGKSLRLNMFHRVFLKDCIPHPSWKIKKGIKWIKDCPLPPGEVFMRLT